VLKLSPKTLRACTSEDVAVARAEDRPTAIPTAKAAPKRKGGKRLVALAVGLSLLVGLVLVIVESRRS
jgi:hypothetical protein